MKSGNETITFKFDGKNVSTDALGRSLLPLAGQVYNLLESCSTEEVRLLSIENNCIKITFARNAAIAVAIFGVIGSETIKDIGKYNSATRAINTMLCKTEGTLEIEDNEKGIVKKFDNQKAIPLMPETHNDIKSTMSIYGELVDIGGVDPNVHIQSEAFEDVVVLKIERDDARKMATRLYNQIGVNANVTIREGKIVAGKVLDIIDYEPEDIEEWLSKNGNRIGIESFKGVNIKEFIAEQRI